MRPAIHKVQEFQGKRYYKRGLYYASNPRGSNPGYMHRDVWRHYNGPIPKGFHVHHKDGDRTNNKIGNLELIDGRKHNSMHSKGRQVVNWRKGVAAARKVKRDWKKAAEVLWATRVYAVYTCALCRTRFSSRVIHRIPLFCGQNCQKKYRRREAKQALETGT
jgi:hypothetical protein